MENDAVKHLYNVSLKTLLKLAGATKERKKKLMICAITVYVQINQEAEADPTIHDEARAFFKLMEDGDEEALGLWRPVP